jgi:hypothetical protein
VGFFNLKMKKKRIKIVNFDPYKLRKQPNCFILFRRDLAEHFHINAKAASRIWRLLSEEEQEQYKCSYGKNTDGQKPGQSVFFFEVKANLNIDIFSHLLKDLQYIILYI